MLKGDSGKLIIGVSTRALYELETENAIFERDGPKAYVDYMKVHQSVPPKPGAAFSFVKNILHLNKVFDDIKPVQAVILSRCNPEAALRIANANQYYGLDFASTHFNEGKCPYQFGSDLNVSLHLSANREQVNLAFSKGQMAAYALPSTNQSIVQSDKSGLHVGFDFDGVIADDSSERMYEQLDQNLDAYFEYEKEMRNEPLPPGPLNGFFKKIMGLRDLERDRYPERFTGHERSNEIRVSIITARNGDALNRIYTSLESYGTGMPDGLNSLGPSPKSKTLSADLPNIFFDDQIRHFEGVEDVACVHVPYGIKNQ